MFCLPEPAAISRSSICLPPDGPAAAGPIRNAPIVAEYFRHCEAERRPPARRPGRGCSARPARSSPNNRAPCRAQPAHDGGVAIRKSPARDRGVGAGFFVDKGRAVGGSRRFLRRLLHPLFRPGRHDRAGRHGKIGNYAHAASRGTIARRASLHLRAGDRQPRSTISNGRGLRVPGDVIDINRCALQRAGRRATLYPPLGRVSCRPMAGDELMNWRRNAQGRDGPAPRARMRTPRDNRCSGAVRPSRCALRALLRMR